MSWSVVGNPTNWLPALLKQWSSCFFHHTKLPMHFAFLLPIRTLTPTRVKGGWVRATCTTADATCFGSGGRARSSETKALTITCYVLSTSSMWQDVHLNLKQHIRKTVFLGKCTRHWERPNCLFARTSRPSKALRPPLEVLEKPGVSPINRPSLHLVVWLTLSTKQCFCRLCVLEAALAAENLPELTWGGLQPQPTFLSACQSPSI